MQGWLEVVHTVDIQGISSISQPAVGFVTQSDSSVLFCVF